MNNSTSNSATILLAHGSSDSNWQQPFFSLSERIQSNCEDGVIAKLAFMELCEPSLESTVEELVQQGIEQIDVLPLFFAVGRHLREDVPAQIESLLAHYHDKGVQLRLSLHPPIGQEPEFTRALTDVVTRYVAESSYRLF